MKLCYYPSGLLGGGSIVPSNPNLPPKLCSQSPNASASHISGSVCDSTVRFRRMSWNKALPSSLLYRDALLTNEHGTSRIPWEFMRLTHNRGWMATVILGQNYNFSFDNAPQLTNISYRYSWVRKQNSSVVDVPYSLMRHFELKVNHLRNCNIKSDPIIP